MVDLSSLASLADYKHIALQCHDVPDADAVCSAYGIQSYLSSIGVLSTLVYSGSAVITKPSLLMFIELMNIEVLHVQELPQDIDLLITIDCQRGAGNVTTLELPNGAEFAIIDHHIPEVPEGTNTIIRSNLAGCATLVWDLLNKVSFDIPKSVLDALYYGLYADSNGMAELSHPLDRDLSEQTVDTALVRKLKNAAITAAELDIMAAALSRRRIVGTIGMFHADPCDTNVLGFTSDIAQQVAVLDCCVVFSRQKHGMKLSIRSSAREIMASEIASFLCRETGSGGGNYEKAGGFMSFSSIKAVAPDVSPEDYLDQRIQAYIDNYDHVYAGEHNIDFSACPLFQKIPRPVGYANSTDIYPEKTKITIRTLEGDVDTVTDEDVCLMIGIQGEVYPIKRERLNAGYKLIDEPYREESEYTPMVINRNTGERHNILPYARVCVTTKKHLIRAMQIKKDTKVFTSWDLDKYYHGDKGSWLAATEDDHGDCYIIREDIFYDTYERVE